MLPYCTTAPTAMERELSTVIILTIVLVILTGFLVLDPWLRRLFTYIWSNCTLSGTICREIEFLRTLPVRIDQLYAMKKKGLRTIRETANIPDDLHTRRIEYVIAFLQISCPECQQIFKVPHPHEDAASGISSTMVLAFLDPRRRYTAFRCCYEDITVSR